MAFRDHGPALFPFRARPAGEYDVATPSGKLTLGQGQQMGMAAAVKFLPTGCVINSQGLRRSVRQMKPASASQTPVGHFRGRSWPRCEEGKVKRRRITPSVHINVSLLPPLQFVADEWGDDERWIVGPQTPERWDEFDTPDFERPVESPEKDAKRSDTKPTKTKRSDPALESFRELPREQRIRKFWVFVIEAVSGLSSEEYYCREYALGGVCPLIIDVHTVIQEVLIPWNDDLPEQLWRVAMVVWLGAGGPGFRTYRHLTSGGLLCGKTCPAAASLPSLYSGEDVEVMYEHLKCIALENGRSEVLSGDGQAVKFRFSDGQGVRVLREWRKSIIELVDFCGGCREGLERLSPILINKHLEKVPWMGSLAIKEFFCYLYPAYPNAFDVNVYLPVGEGAVRGARAVLGLAKGAKWHEEFCQMVQAMPSDLGAQLAHMIRLRARQCPFQKDTRVPGAVRQLMDGRPTVGDVEVCMCFFMNFLRAKHAGYPPRGWQMLKRSYWKT